METQMIITKQHALKLISAGRAVVRGTAYDNVQDRTYAAVVRLDVQRVDYYFSHYGKHSGANSHA
jgi:hypothetical protein